MKTISQLIITMMICLFSIQTWAQSGKLFNTDNQLSSNLATQVFQDKSGFIWIATRNGLNTYDGYNITVIKKNMSNFLSLNSNYINSIAQDEKEHILLGTNNSLLEFTGSEFLKIPMLDSKGKELATYVKQIYPLRNKDVAVATSGYGIMLKKQGAQECHAMKGEVEKLKYIHKLLEDKRGRLWIITEDGKLYRKETNGRVTSHFAGTEGVGAQDILQDALGNLYLASKNQGVYLLRAGSNTFTLQLSTFTYNDVEQISYVYSINGDAWRTVPAGQNELAFSHMAPGRYKYRIKAICNGYETPVKEFTIIIHPAWYASIWAKLFYLLLLIAAIMLYLRYRKRQMEDQLILQQHIHAEDMGEAKIKFFMNISHEIRTPLTLIITPLLSLIKEDKEPHRQGIYEIIRKNSERILHLINQMMDLRKIDKGQMVMRMCQTDMVGFINEEYELFRQQALAKNIDFEYQHDSEELPVWIDRNNFNKVIINLLSNAFKFTPTAGHILLSLTHTDHHAYISVKDSGIGIPKDKLETIFQRFYQTPADTSDRNVGTGIGLDLTRSLVELHYGTISARNNEGEKGSKFEHGSEFIIRIPLGKDHLKPEELIDEEEIKEKQNQELAEVEQLEQEVKETENAEKAESAAGTTDMQGNLPASASGNKAEIVIVEDEEDIQDYLKAQLSSDFKIRTYPNGKVALNEILKNKPDLIISDIMMPEMDGTTLCAKLKSNINTNDVPVILLTAKSREEDQLEGLQTGADAYILKPFNMDILRRTIINLLTMRRTLKNKFTGKESQEEKVEQRKIQTPDDALMQRVMEVINENIGDSDLSVDMIAQKVGISRVHLHRKMKELTNQTPHSFIRNIRLQQAAKLLKNGKQSITEVMYACGFSNSASFSTMFKNLYGCSPREYMQNAMKE